MLHLRLASRFSILPCFLFRFLHVCMSASSDSRLDFVLFLCMSHNASSFCKVFTYLPGRCDMHISSPSKSLIRFVILNVDTCNANVAVVIRLTLPTRQNSCTPAWHLQCNTSGYLERMSFICDETSERVFPFDDTPTHVRCISIFFVDGCRLLLLRRREHDAQSSFFFFGLFCSTPDRLSLSLSLRNVNGHLRSLIHDSLTLAVEFPKMKLWREEHPPEI